MAILELTFYIIYNLVALFYLVCGVLLLLYPNRIETLLKKLFPLLASFKYSALVNSLNLILVGSLLIIVGKLIGQHNIIGIYFALVLSALEVYLGFKFYYFEERDVTQANIHVILHSLLCVILIGMSLLYFSDQISNLHNDLALVIKSF